MQAPIFKVDAALFFSWRSTTLPWSRACASNNKKKDTDEKPPLSRQSDCESPDDVPSLNSLKRDHNVITSHVTRPGQIPSVALENNKTTADTKKPNSDFSSIDEISTLRSWHPLKLSSPSRPSSSLSSSPLSNSVTAAVGTPTSSGVENVLAIPPVTRGAVRSPASSDAVNLTSTPSMTRKAVPTLSYSGATSLFATPSKTKGAIQTTSTTAVTIHPTTKTLVLKYSTSNPAVPRTIHTNSNIDTTKYVLQDTRSSQYPVHKSSVPKGPLALYDSTSLSTGDTASQQVGPRIVPSYPDRGPITRLVPIRADQRPVAQRPPSESRGSSSFRNSKPCGQCSNCAPSSGNKNIEQRDLLRTAESGNKNNRAPATPIIVVHQPHHFRYLQRKHDSRNYAEDNRMHNGEEENEEEENFYEDDEEDLEEDAENLMEDEEVNDEEYEVEDEEEIEAATLDLRGLFVREALAAVQVFLPEQDKRYIDSEFDDNRRFVYIVTGWGKLSPGQIPKLKPAVEELLNSTTYKLKYSYEWTNNGEMEVDLIRRKKEAELKKRSEERMKQRQKNKKEEMGLY
ncbi:hypothetical protein ElyMa_004201600 [Elysia marginata]|uniref:Smr domain-containing protein n=1 Tax=Elysia marginata TaxID=1093978 RepID=A0AAV4GNG9_9GAST|nr:hypothetical protein ElyMa_004201600 [Elysia marginata]